MFVAGGNGHSVECLCVKCQPRYVEKERDRLKLLCGKLEADKAELVDLLTEARDDVAAKLSDYADMLPHKQRRYDAQKETLDKIDTLLTKVKGE